MEPQSTNSIEQNSTAMAADDTPAVLIIEDDMLILDIIVLKFRKANWKVFSATDGERGMQKLSDNRPDIIMLDILLPGISGYEVLQQLKDDPATRDIPVLVLSNYGQKEEIEKSLSLGAIDHLVKANVILDEVVEKANRILTQS